MSEREDAILQSLDKTVDFCIKNREDFKHLPTFNDEILILDGLTRSMHGKIQDLVGKTQDFTTAKNMAKIPMVEKTLSHAAYIYAYAGVHRDFIIPNVVKVTYSSLMRLRDNKLGDVCRAILKLVIQMSDQLSPYGLIPELSTNLDSLIADYESKLIGTPEYNASQNSIKGSLKSDYDKACDLANKTLDPLVELLKDTKPGIYSEYGNMRKIILKAGRTLSLKGKAINASTGDAIWGAIVSITRVENPDSKGKTDTDVQKTVKRTSTRGGFQISSLPSGTYIITVTKAGYTSEPITVYINDGEMTRVVIKMVKL